LKQIIFDEKDMDTAKQIEFQYQLRKVQKEIENIGKKLSEMRKKLLDLTEENSIKNLEDSINADRHCT